MNRRAKIIKKFGSIKHFCELSDRNYRTTTYAISAGTNPMTLAEIDRDIEGLKPHKIEPEKLSERKVSELHKAILSKYGKVSDFCRATGNRQALVSEIVTHQRKFRTKAVDRVFKCFGL